VGQGFTLTRAGSPTPTTTAAAGAAAVRSSDARDLGPRPIAEIIERMRKEVEERNLT
jgi:hypothetical protein